ncbi:MAG: hypothetical protein NC415_11690 [bacterium]|nr:hypothetical protein [bacterium]
MDTEIKSAVNAADDAQYDQQAKRLLGNKIILGHILVKTVDEFKGMDENCMDYVHLTDDKLIGSHSWKGGLDLLNIVLIGIANELPKHDDTYELHRLLSALLSMELTADEKFGIMEKEYSIPVNDRMREDVKVMCNLSQGIREKGRAEGKAESEIQFILTMHEMGYPSAQIAEIVKRTIEEVEAVIKKRELIMA